MKKEARNLSGIYFRVQRGKKFVNRCFEDCSEVEQNEILKQKSKKFISQLCIGMARVVREIADKFDLCREWE